MRNVVGMILCILYLNEIINADLVLKSVLVHSRCYRNIKRPGLKSLEMFDEMPNAKKLRSSVAPYNWKNNCLLCVKSAIMDVRHPPRLCVHKIVSCILFLLIAISSRRF